MIEIPTTRLVDRVIHLPSVARDRAEHTMNLRLRARSDSTARGEAPLTPTGEQQADARQRCHAGGRPSTRASQQQRDAERGKARAYPSAGSTQSPDLLPTNEAQPHAGTIAHLAADFTRGAGSARGGMRQAH